MDTPLELIPNSRVPPNCIGNLVKLSTYVTKIVIPPSVDRTTLWKFITSYHTWERLFPGTLVLRPPSSRINTPSDGILVEKDNYIEKIESAAMTCFMIKWHVHKLVDNTSFDIIGSEIWGNDIYRFIFGWMNLKMLWQYTLTTTSEGTLWTRSFSVYSASKNAKFIYSLLSFYVSPIIMKEANLYMELVRNELLP